MALGYRMTKASQDIIQIVSFAFLAFLVSHCGSTSKYTISDASPKFKEFQGSDLDPYSKQQTTAPRKTSNPVYDDFLLAAKKTIVTLELAEKTSGIIESKKTVNEDLQRERIAAGVILTELPTSIDGLNSLQRKCIELQDTAPNDFEGPKLGQVSEDLDKANNDLIRFISIAPKILQSLRDSQNDSRSQDETKQRSAQVMEVQAPKTDPVIPKNTEIVSSQPKKEDNKKWKDYLPPEEKQKTLVIQKKPKKAKIEGNTKNFLTTEPANLPEPEDNLTEEEKKERQYTEQLKTGLVDVFKSEYFRNSKSLEKILLSHPIPRVRSAAALALGRIKKGRKSLQYAIDKDGYQVRPAAFKALADIGDKQSLSYFQAGVKAEDPEVVAASFEGLGKTQDPSGRDLILNQGIISEYVIIVAGAIRGLAYNHLPQDLELFQRFLGSEEEEITDAAIEGLVIHDHREALRILERTVIENPKLAKKILDEIGRSPKLSATFSLIRLNDTLRDPSLLKKINEFLLRRKAFGRYALILEDNDFLRSEPNERSTPVSYLKKNEIGLVVNFTKKEYAVRMNEEILTDRYLQLKIESTVPSSRNPYVIGWVFEPKVEIIEIKELGGTDSTKISHTKAKKHQNLFNPENKKNQK